MLEVPFSIKETNYKVLGVGQVFKKLTTFFKSMGVKAIFDTSCSRDLTLIEACNEFIARYRNSQQDNEEKCKSSVPMISSACPGIFFFWTFGYYTSMIIVQICTFNFRNNSIVEGECLFFSGWTKLVGIMPVAFKWASCSIWIVLTPIYINAWVVVQLIIFTFLSSL